MPMTFRRLRLPALPDDGTLARRIPMGYATARTEPPL